MDRELKPSLKKKKERKLPISVSSRFFVIPRDRNKEYFHSNSSKEILHDEGWFINF